MIDGILVNGVEITSDKIHLVGFADGASAAIEHNTYSRGGRDGVASGTPFYRGWVGSFQLHIVADTFAELADLRDYVALVFALNPNKSKPQTKRLGIRLANGVTKEAPVVFQKFGGDISPDKSVSSIIQISAQSEQEFLTSPTKNKAEVRIQNLGGMAVPMGVPMSMAEGASDVVTTITNKGNAESYPVITVHGPLDGFDIINQTTDITMSYSDELEEEDVLVIDMYRHTAILNGAANVLHKLTPNWWWLIPSDNIVKLISSSGSGYAEIEWHAAYRGV